MKLTQRDSTVHLPDRWAQLAFVEDDPGGYEADLDFDYFRRIDTDAAY